MDMWDRTTKKARAAMRKQNPNYKKMVGVANMQQRQVPSPLVVDTMEFDPPFAKPPFDQPSFLSQNVSLPPAHPLLASQTIGNHRVPTKAGVYGQTQARDASKQAIPELPVPFPDPQTDPIVTSLKETRELGRGAFGRVMAASAVDARGRPIELAKKIMLVDITSPEARSQLITELRKEVTMVRLVAPYKIYNAYIERDPATNKEHVVMLMELIHGSDGDQIKKLMGKYLSPRQAKDLLAYLLSVAGCMENLGAVHRDIKPANLIYKQSVLSSKKDEVVLVDWGLGCKYIDPNMFPRCSILVGAGTPMYMSPYLYTAASDDAVLMGNMTRRIFPCLSPTAQKLATKALRSGTAQDFTTLLQNNEVSHLLLRMNDLWAIAFTVMDMADIAPPMRSTVQFGSALNSGDYAMAAKIMASTNLIELAKHMNVRGIDPAMTTTLLRIIDFKGEIKPVECPSAAELLAGLYGKSAPSATKDMCAVTRRQAHMAASERGELERSHRAF